MTSGIVVPAYRAEATLADSLQALLDQKPSPPDRIVVVDDGSPDGTAGVAEGFARRHPGRIELVARTENGGEAAALNAGFARLDQDLVGIVEADVLVAPDWLDRLAKRLERTGAVGAGGALRPFPGDAWPARLAGYEVEARQASQQGHEVRHVTSANALYRRRAWEKAGPFREELYNASLDSDFNARLLASGERLAWDPGASAWHHYKPSVLGFLARTLAYARTRWRVSVLALYPGDRDAAAVLVLDVLAWASLLGPWELAVAAWAAALLAHAPLAREVLVERRDPAGLLLPPLMVLRGGVAALGLALGLLEQPVSRP